jgi:hypothetical protein
LGHCPKVSILSGKKHHGHCRTTDNVCTQKTDIIEIRKACVFFAHSLPQKRIFLNRFRFARKGCLIYEQIFGLDYSYIGRDYVPRGQVDNISRNQFAHGDFCHAYIKPLHSSRGNDKVGWSTVTI